MPAHSPRYPGRLIYGDASDGVVTISSNTTLAADKVYDTLTVNAGFTLDTDGYRVYARNQITIAATAVVSNDGTAGGNGVSGGAVGSGGAATGDNSIGWLSLIHI